jgi:hypothetical protein
VVSVDGTPDGGAEAAGEDGAEPLADVGGADAGAVPCGEADDGAGAPGRVRGAGRDNELPTVGACGGNVAFGLRDSTLVFSRLTSSMRSCRRPPSFSPWTLVLTSAS